MVIDLPYAGLRRTGRKLYAPGPKAREFVPYPVSGTAPCRVLRALRASGAATIHPANPRAARRLRVAMNIGVHVVNAWPWATADSICRSGRERKRWSSSRCGFRTRWSSQANFSRLPLQHDPALRHRSEQFLRGAERPDLPCRAHQTRAPRDERAVLPCATRSLPNMGVGRGAVGARADELGARRALRAGPVRHAVSGAATDEAIRLFRAAWAQGAEVSFTGDVYRFQPVWFLPKPARPGGPPIWVGGNGRRSIRRAAELGDGWHTVRIGLDELRTGVATLHELLDRNGRSAADVVISGKFSLYCPGTGPRGEPHESELTGSAELIAARLRSYRDAGLQYLVLDPTQHGAPAEALEAIEFFAREVRPLLG